MDDILKSRRELYDPTNHIVKKFIPASTRHLINARLGARETVDVFVSRDRDKSEVERMVHDKLFRTIGAEIHPDCVGCLGVDIRIRKGLESSRHADVWFMDARCNQAVCDKAGGREVVEFDGVSAMKDRRKTESEIRDDKVVGSW